MPSFKAFIKLVILTNISIYAHLWPGCFKQPDWLTSRNNRALFTP